MPIVGTFEADFSQFTSAVRGAEGSLRNLETNAGQVTTSVTRMGGQLASLATAFGVTFSAAAVVNFTREVVRAADELTKLSSRTGLSTDALQRFQVVGDDAGNTVNEIAAAIVQLEDRVAGGDKSAAQAFETLGINIEEFKRLSPEEKLVAFSDALRTASDSGVQLNTTIDAMGRAGATILPTLKHGFDDVRDSAVGMSAESIKAIDDFGDSIGRASRALKAFGGEAFGQVLLTILDPMGDTKRELNAMTEAANKARPALAAIPPPGIPENLDAIEQELTQNVKALIAASEWAEKTAIAYQKLLSDVANETGLAQMNEAAETMARAAKNEEGLWLMERDAWQQNLAAKEAAAAALAEQEAATAAANTTIEEGLIIVGQSAQAHTAAGAAAVGASSVAQQSYAALASSIGVATQQADRFIVSQRQMMELGTAQRQFNQGRATTTQEDLLRGFEIVTARGGAPGGGGSGVTVNVDASGASFDTPEGQRRFFDRVGEAVKATLKGQGRSLGSTA